ncbi:MAG: apolipoprotein N-acyltransferase [Desulfovibrionales bacterium]
MLFLVLLTLAGTWFGFANPVAHIPVLVLLLPVGLCMLAKRSTGLGKAFRSGWLLGGAAAALSLYWVVIPVHEYGNYPLLLALPCPVLLGLYIGLYTGAFTVFLSWAGKRLPWILTGILAGSFWASLELLRNWLFTGFPWLTISSAFAPWPFALQTASIVGGFGLSGILVTGCAWLVFGKDRMRPFLLSGALFIGVGLFGVVRLDSLQPTGPSVSVAVIQGNIDQSRKWDAAYQEKTVRKYLDLSRREIVANDPDLVVWPETALPFYFQEENGLSELIVNLAEENSMLLLTGAPGYSKSNDGYEYFNRAFLLGPEARQMGSYDKEHLVPFGEYIPLRTFFPFMTALASGVGDFSSGKNTGPLRAGNLALGTLICYEAIFPELAQKRVAHGANLLVNISNDAWFGRSSAPKQHLDLAVLRAVEQHRFLIRSTNTGISTLVDPGGRILDQAPLFTTTSLYFDRVPVSNKKTLYHRLHEFIHAGYIIVTSFLLLSAWWFGGMRLKGDD